MREEGVADDIATAPGLELKAFKYFSVSDKKKERNFI